MFGFNIWQKLKHPQNPNLTNFSSDAFDPRPSNAWFGRVFVPKSTARKDPVGSYKNETIKIVFSLFNKKYKDQFKLQPQDFENAKNDTWFAHGVKIDQEFQLIAEALCEELIIKEHSFRYALEKINRRSLFDLYLAENKENLKTISVQQFINDLSSICENSVNLCKKSKDDMPVYDTTNLQKNIKQFKRVLKVSIDNQNQKEQE